ncbi:MAG: flagellar hook-basal body complex protein, partial [Rhodospirillaceae bacterium]|nr:flagellar hook-basal body complex protein [Rhodospirillaceae bacterium]
DVQFFDTLGNPNTVRFTYTRSTTSNQWNVSAEPPTGVAVTTLYNDAGNVYDSIGQIEFTSLPADGKTVTIGGTVYTFQAAAPANTYDDNLVRVATGTTVSQAVSELIKEFNIDNLGATGNPYNNTVGTTYAAAAIIFDPTTGTVYQNTSGALSPAVTAADTTLTAYMTNHPGIFTEMTTRAYVKSGASGTMVINGDTAGSIAVTGLTALAATKQGLDTDSFTVLQKTVADPGITFSSTGEPSAFNLTKMEMLNFSNGASDMNDATGASPRIKLDFGTVGENNGFTQYAGDYTPQFITQNGSRFGTFSGVTISAEGLVTALFDNGDTRTIFKIPVATFVNPNGLEGRTGNVWNATEGSGDYTLRDAGNGPAGLVTQASLEASTVDIGSEFTSMIVVQRAYSASTKIISTADQMLEELMRTKR